METMFYAPCAFFSLATPLKIAHHEIRVVFSKRSGYSGKWKTLDPLDIGNQISTKIFVQEVHRLLAQASSVSLRLCVDHAAQIWVQKKRSDALKTQAVDLLGQVIKVEDLLCAYRAKERMAIVEPSTLTV